MEEFLVESRAHGWPSFRGKFPFFRSSVVHSVANTDLTSVRLHVFDLWSADAEVNWEKVRILPDGETVSLVGTHLGHNLVRRSDA
jgi:hypothetical protein